MDKKIYKMFEKVGIKYFFGDFFDGRFFVGKLVSKKKTKVMLDIGCGTGVLLNCSDAPLKIGLDISLESLKRGKILNPKMQLIVGDAIHLPFKKNYFPDIIAMHLLSEVHTFQKEKWLDAASEIKRIAADNCEIILTGANRPSKHFEKRYSLDHRKNYLTYQEQIDFFNDEFQVSVAGYGPHSRVIMYPFKIIHKLPDILMDNLGITRLLYRFLRAKRYLKNGRSYVIVCKRHKDCKIAKTISGFVTCQDKRN